MRKYIVIVLALGIAGCGTYPVTVATSNVMKPVLVGKVRKINGTPQNIPADQGQSFSLVVEKSFFSTWNHQSKTKEHANKFDAELMRLTGDDDASEMILIDSITLKGKKSEGLILPFVKNSDYTLGYLNGSIHKTKGGK